MDLSSGLLSQDFNSPRDMGHPMVGVTECERHLVKCKRLQGVHVPDTLELEAGEGRRSK